MNSSRPQSSADTSAPSLGISGRRIHSLQINLDFDAATGSLNHDPIVRSALSASIRMCSLSREQIADKMSDLLGTRVTAKMLDTYSAASMQPYRLPAAWIHAFCKAVDNDSLLQAIAQAGGYRLVRNEEVALLELGRQYLRRKRADEEATRLEQKLQGLVEL
jgi:hypothetical protein